MKKYLIIIAIGIFTLFFLMFVLDYIDFVDKNKALEKNVGFNVFFQTKLLRRVKNLSVKEKELNGIIENIINERDFWKDKAEQNIEGAEKLKTEVDFLSRNVSEAETKKTLAVKELQEEKGNLLKVSEEMSAGLKQSEEVLMNKIKNARKELEENEKKNRELIQDLRNAEKEKQVLAGQVGKLMEEKEAKNNEILKLTEEINKNEFSKKLQEALKEKEVLKVNVEEMKKQVEDIKKQSEEIKKQVDEKEKQITKKIQENETGLIKSKKEIEKLNKELSEAKEAQKTIKVKSYYNFGVFYTQIGKFDEAVDSYNKALEIDPNYAQVHFNIGIVYDEYKNQPVKAIPHYEKYLQLMPNAPDAEKVREWLGAGRQKVK